MITDYICTPIVDKGCKIRTPWQLWNLGNYLSFDANEKTKDFWHLYNADAVVASYTVNRIKL